MRIGSSQSFRVGLIVEFSQEQGCQVYIICEQNLFPTKNYIGVYMALREKKVEINFKN